tara:strand:+ start:243 stop:1388 length:1146 start_codon:yes stop_codon:yes gene_type:complete
MKINIYGSTGIIGSKTLFLISRYFPKIKVNLLCANSNVKKLIKQIYTYKPKYVYLNNENKRNYLISKLPSRTKLLNYEDLKIYLKNSYSDFSLLAISGYKSLNYFDLILNNTVSIGLVSKETIVSAGHLFSKIKKNKKVKIFPIDSEHFSIFNFINNSKKNFIYNNILLTASGGPFLGKKFSSLKDISFEKASKHPRWKMGYKNSIDSATLSNKCLELIEAHYLFDIPFNKLNIVIHPEAKVHSIFEFNNHIYNMIYFFNDMNIPIFHFLNQTNNLNFTSNIYKFNFNQSLEFKEVKNEEFPIYKFFKNLNKQIPSNLIRFNVANEFAVDLFKRNLIRYTDIYNIIKKISSLNLNYNLNNIKDIIKYHELLEIKINEKIKF